MNKVTEKPRNFAFILSEADSYLSRDTVTIVSGAGKLVAGTVLGKITASGKYMAAPNAEVEDLEGAETAVAVLAEAVDASSADVKALVVSELAVLKKGMLSFHSSVDNETKKTAKLAQLRAVHIKAR